jgi:predicted membrane protein
VSTALQDPPSRVHLPSLAVALAIMVGGTLYPPLMADAAGRADHGLATALFWAMSAGFVRGVGFVPRATVWRWLFSGWACAAGLLLAGVLKFQH